jgi:two-component system sensor histidine kinase KdpD
MVYLLAVAFVASRFGPRETAVSAALSVLLFDVLFVPPRFTLAVSDSQYIVTFAIMLGVALLISSLTFRVRQQAKGSADRERRTAALYTLSKEMARARSKREIALAAAKEIRDVFEADTAVLFQDKDLVAVASSISGFEREPNEAAAASWSLKNDQVAGKGTETLPGSRGLYVPLRGSKGPVGVLAVLPSETGWPWPAAQRNLLETFANGLGLAIERTTLAKESHEARLQAESERIRNALLSSISHDLRTPLTAIAGAASSLKEGQGNQQALAETIYEESVRLNMQVQNLLDMTRLQSGEVKLRLEWHSAEELVASALERAQELLEHRTIEVKLSPELPLVSVDGELIAKVLVNLLENVSTHTPAGTPVEISADDMREVLRINVADRGPGVANGDEVRIFERFFRREGRRDTAGFGLGLAICRAVMKLHNGRVWVENRRDGTGAVFHVEIPKPAKQPEVPRG